MNTTDNGHTQFFDRITSGEFLIKNHPQKPKQPSLLRQPIHALPLDQIGCVLAIVHQHEANISAWKESVANVDKENESTRKRFKNELQLLSGFDKRTFDLLYDAANKLYGKIHKAKQKYLAIAKMILSDDNTKCCVHAPACEAGQPFSCIELNLQNAYTIVEEIPVFNLAEHLWKNPTEVLTVCENVVNCTPEDHKPNSISLVKRELYGMVNQPMINCFVSSMEKHGERWYGCDGPPDYKQVESMIFHLIDKVITAMESEPDRTHARAFCGGILVLCLVDKVFTSYEIRYCPDWYTVSARN